MGCDFGRGLPWSLSGALYLLSKSMLIVITITSILGVTIVVWLANRILPFQVCPICAGVFGTWVGLLSAYFLGYPIDLVVPPPFMGGAVGGGGCLPGKKKIF